LPTEVRRDILQDWPVLVVEDDPASMEIAAFMLRHYGAKVDTATNGAEGLALARTSLPRFILTDMSMPILDGWTMLEEMKKDRKLSSIPVIALTAHAMPGDREKAIAAGCHNYLTKPLTAATFINSLLNLLVDIPELRDELTLSASPKETPAALPHVPEKTEQTETTVNTALDSTSMNNTTTPDNTTTPIKSDL